MANFIFDILSAKYYFRDQKVLVDILASRLVISVLITMNRH